MRTYFALVAGSVFLVACGRSKSSSSDDSTATGNPQADEVVRAYCETVRSCCRDAGFSEAPIADCEPTVSEFEWFQAVLSERAVFRESERVECIAWIEAMAGTCVQADDSPCQRMFDGTLGEGEACEDSIECQRSAAGVACFRSSLGGEVPDTGVCRRLLPGELGSPCFTTIDEDRYGIGYTTDDPNPSLVTCDLRDGLFCDSATHTCQPLVGPAEACVSEGCEAGLYCDETCFPQLNLGSSCDGDDQCEPDLGCVSGFCVVQKITDGDLCQGDLE